MRTKNIGLSIVAVFLLSLGISVTAISVKAEASERLAPSKDKYIVVIDPGHGGDNLGTDQGLNGVLEKEMDYITATAIYNELLQYDNIEVYMSRTKDEDISLKKRAEYAAAVKADYLFSIHYNASESHNLFGSEVWVSQFAPYNQNGYQFGVIELEMLREKGLFIRGVKTRKSEEAGSSLDYYGIIRHSVANNITPVIIEHCHVDQKTDAAFCSSEEQWRQFGIIDATAIAKYLGLYSKEKNIDYRDTHYAQVDPDSAVKLTIKDQTPPEYVKLELVSTDEEAHIIVIRAEGCDSDSPLMYYSISTNGGLDFGDYNPWPGCDTLNGSYEGEFELTVDALDKDTVNIVVRAYNMFDAHSDSNLIKVEFASDVEEAFNEKNSDDLTIVQPSDAQEYCKDSKDVRPNIKRVRDFLLILLLFMLMVLLSTFAIVTAYRKRKNEEDDET